MNPGQQVLAGLSIIGVVATGAWYSGHSERIDSALPSMTGVGTSSGGSLSSINYVEWSADGRALVALSRGEGGSAALSLSLYDTIQKINYPIDLPDGPISCTSLAPDGLHVLVATYDGQLLWIDLRSIEPESLGRLSPNECVTAAAFANDGQQIAAGTNAGDIYIFDATGKRIVTLASAQTSSIGDLHFSSDGRMLVSAQNDGCIFLWNLGTRSVLNRFEGYEKPVTAAVILPDDRRIISAGLDDTIRIWDIASGREQWRGEFVLDGVLNLAVSPDGRTAAWAGRNRRFIVWDVEHLKMKFDFHSSASTVNHLSFSPDGASLAVAGNEGTIRLYDLRSGSERPGIDVRQTGRRAIIGPAESL